jgi:hypothetical protein
MKLDGMQQWLLMTKILSVTYYNSYLEPIWSWKSRDYQRHNDVMPLQELKK